MDDLNANDRQFDRNRFDEIQDRARRANIVLASVGQNWLNGIQNENDPVRLVIRTALKSGVVVAPVLVNGARMPTPEQLPRAIKNFAYRSAIVIDPGADFDNHIKQLIQSVETIVGSSDTSAPSIRSSRTENQEIAARVATSQPPPGTRRPNLATTGTAAQIFISHSSQDRKIADTIVQALNPAVCNAGFLAATSPAVRTIRSRSSARFATRRSCCLSLLTMPTILMKSKRRLVWPVETN